MNTPIPKKYCWSCGHKIAPNTNFCIRCGSRLNGDRVSQDPKLDIKSSEGTLPGYNPEYKNYDIKRTTAIQSVKENSAVNPIDSYRQYSNSKSQYITDQQSTFSLQEERMNVLRREGEIPEVLHSSKHIGVLKLDDGKIDDSKAAEIEKKVNEINKRVKSMEKALERLEYKINALNVMPVDNKITDLQKATNSQYIDLKSKVDLITNNMVTSDRLMNLMGDVSLKMNDIEADMVKKMEDLNKVIDAGKIKKMISNTIEEMSAEIIDSIQTTLNLEIEKIWKTTTKNNLIITKKINVLDGKLKKMNTMNSINSFDDESITAIPVIPQKKPISFVPFPSKKHAEGVKNKEKYVGKTTDHVEQVVKERESEKNIKKQLSRMSL